MIGGQGGGEFKGRAPMSGLMAVILIGLGAAVAVMVGGGYPKKWRKK